jgi:predicted GNAT family acetyltransferase
MKERILATRPAASADFDYAWKVYQQAIRPLIEPQLQRTWVESNENARFRSVWNEANAHVITLDGTAVGWAAANVTDTEVEIEHFYIEEPHRGKGYATRILTELIRNWLAEGKSVHASVLTAGRATALAKRLGFSHQRQDELVTLMVNAAPQPSGVS